MLKLFSLILFSFLSTGSSSTDECDDWVAFKNEKCFKVFDVSSTQTEAEGVCREKSNGSVLAIIKTSEEQEIINKYLNKTNIADNVWIGIKKSNNSYKYSDGTDINYINWIEGRPVKNSTESKCVEISVDEINFGKWMDNKCHKKNAVLCQKVQTLSVERLQSILLETRRLYNEKIEEITNELGRLKRTTITDGHKILFENMEVLRKVVNAQRNELDIITRITIPAQQKVIDSLTSNPVPIGFIYVQLSGQSESKTLWPNTEWENVSEEYSGFFFRTEGGESSPFGRIQEQQTQSLEILFDLAYNQVFPKRWIKITDTPFDNNIETGVKALGKNGALI